MMNCPQHSNSIDLVESFFCIYRYKSPIFCGQLSVPNRLNPVDSVANSRFKSGTKLVILTNLLVDSGTVTLSTHLEKMCLHVSPTLTGQNPGCFSSAFRRTDINKQQDTQGGLPLAIHLIKVSTLLRGILCPPRVLNPPLQSFRVHTYRALTPRKFLRDQFDQILRNVHRNKNRCFVIDLQRVGI